MKSFEEYLRENILKGNIDFRIRASEGLGGVIEFYIHPNGVNGETLDYVVNGSITNPKSKLEPWYG